MTRPPSSAEPRVSVIVPVYNGVRHLAGALDTICAQTFAPLEVIFVDDGSTDGSGDLLRELRSSYSGPIEFRIVTQKNSGQSASRNAAAAVARGDFYAFLDQDDLWAEDHLARLLTSFTAAPGVGVSYSDFDEIDGAGRLVMRRFIDSHGLSHPKSSVGAFVSEDTMMIPTATVVRAIAFHSVGGFDPVLVGYEDDDLWFRMFRAGWHMRYLSESTAAFRVHPGSSSTRSSFRASRLAFFHKVVAELPDDPRLGRYYITDLVLPRLIRSSLMEYQVAVRRRDDGEARAIATFINELAQAAGGGRVGWSVRLVLRHPSLARFVGRFRQRFLRRARISPVHGLRTGRIVNPGPALGR